MNLPARIRTMDKRLRVLAIATAILTIPLLGQILSIANINASGHEGDLAVFFIFLGIFTVPTSLILTSAVFSGIRHHWRTHALMSALSAINTLVALNLIWFFAAPCSWSHALGIALTTCPK